LSDRKEYFEPYLVLGTGRSGTSTVARILHTCFDIFMGENFRSPDKNNPKGFWEDIEFRNINNAILTGEANEYQWRNVFEHLIIKRRTMYKSWGIKDPRICDLIKLYLEYFKKPIIIRCNRNMQSIIDSMVSCYGWAYEEAEKLYRHRMSMLDAHLDGREVLEISFDEDISDEKIVELIKDYMKRE